VDANPQTIAVHPIALHPRKGLPVLKQSPLGLVANWILRRRGMLATMLKTAKNRSRGISIVEILIAAAVLVVLISFATTAQRTATAKTELRAAAENLEFSVRAARMTARQFETDIIMNINTDPLMERHSVTFTFPPSKARLSSQLQDFLFSPEIRLVSDAPFVRFDGKGMPQIPATVVLVSSRNDDFSQELVIE